MTAELGQGYGSEFHLMRLLGRYRRGFTKMVCDAMDASDLQWLDFRPGGAYKAGAGKVELPDNEWKGLDFLTTVVDSEAPIFEAWQEFWPQSGNVHNWDAVARGRFGQPAFWLLVEAKAHTEEIRSDCGAKSPASRGRITRAMRRTQNSLNVQDRAPEDWLNTYYQFANRLATLYFLTEQGLHARLLFVYMCGDKNPGADCPATRAEWQQPLQKQEAALGLQNADLPAHGVHKLFVDVEKVQSL